MFSSPPQNWMCLSTIPGGQAGGLGSAPVTPENLYQAVGKHDIPVFASFALLDANQPAFGIDIGHFDGDSFGNAQSRSIAEHQRGTVFEAGNVIKEGQGSS